MLRAGRYTMFFMGRGPKVMLIMAVVTAAVGAVLIVLPDLLADAQLHSHANSRTIPASISASSSLGYLLLAALLLIISILGIKQSLSRKRQHRKRKRESSTT